MAQTLTEIKDLLAARGLRPKHRLGQNFLHDHNMLRKIVAAADLSPGDRVLEVGPGTGALTEWLLGAGASVAAVEADADLEPVLRQRLGEAIDTGRLRLHIGSALAGKHALSPEAIDGLRDDAGGVGPFKLIANLPYDIASPLLANLVVDRPEMTAAVVMIQREVADRLTAGPGGKAYGPLGIVIAAGCEAQTVATLPPTCFWPRPKVHSAVVRVTRRTDPVVAAGDLPAFSGYVHRLFAKRRKQIGAIVGPAATLPEGVDRSARPESLTVGQLAQAWRLDAARPPALQ